MTASPAQLRVWALRHAESVFNATQVDDFDTPLTDKGALQAAGAKGDFDLVLVSPMLRCRQTFLFSGVRASHIGLCDVIRERREHKCDFLVGEAVERESEEVVLQRAKAALVIVRLIAAFVGAERTLMVTHADLVFWMTSHVEEGEQFGQWLDNAEMYEFDNDNDN